MSGEQRMRARTGGHMASATTLAQLGITAGAGQAAGRSDGGGAGSARTPGENPQIHSRDSNG